MMTTEAGTIFDVLKLSVLADIFANQRVSEYWESHAANALTEGCGEEGHGLGRYVAQAGTNVPLARAPLYRWLEPVRNGVKLAQVPGMAWLAMRALGSEARRYLFCGTDAEALQAIEAARRGLNVVETKVEYVQDDGVMLLRGACIVLAEEWTASTVVFLDPANTEPEADGSSSLQLWSELVNRGIPALLAYTFADDGERIVARRRFAEVIERSKIGSRNIYRFEGAFVHQGGEGGARPWGFGLLTANLRDETILAADKHLFELQGLYAGTRLPGGGDGMWKYSGGRGGM